MAISIAITQPVSKPKNGAKNGYFITDLTLKYKDFDGKYYLTSQSVQIWT